jgi:transposase-like protein
MSSFCACAALSLRNLEEMMAERGIEVDHSSVHRWVIKLVPLFQKPFRRHKRQSAVKTGVISSLQDQLTDLTAAGVEAA